jgi:hypothetical protein
MPRGQSSLKHNNRAKPTPMRGDAWESVGEAENMGAFHNSGARFRVILVAAV